MLLFFTPAAMPLLFHAASLYMLCHEFAALPLLPRLLLLRHTLTITPCHFRCCRLMPCGAAMAAFAPAYAIISFYDAFRFTMRY